MNPRRNTRMFIYSGDHIMHWIALILLTEACMLSIPTIINTSCMEFNHKTYSAMIICTHVGVQSPVVNVPNPQRSLMAKALDVILHSLLAFASAPRSAIHYTCRLQPPGQGSHSAVCVSETCFRYHHSGIPNNGAQLTQP